MLKDKKFYTIINGDGLFMMVNEEDKVVTVCHSCMKSSEIKQGHVTNKEDCEHKE